MEIVIIALLLVWLVLALRHTKKHGCCGDCAKCRKECNNGNKND